MTIEKFSKLKPGDIILLKDTTYEEVNVVKAYFMKVTRTGQLGSPQGRWGKNIWADYIYAVYSEDQQLDYGVYWNAKVNLTGQHMPMISTKGGDVFKKHLVQDLFEKKTVYYKGGLDDR